LTSWIGVLALVLGVLAGLTGHSVVGVLLLAVAVAALFVWWRGRDPLSKILDDARMIAKGAPSFPPEDAERMMNNVSAALNDTARRVAARRGTQVVQQRLRDERADSRGAQEDLWHQVVDRALEAVS
jgi:hypothetical protein